MIAFKKFFKDEGGAVQMTEAALVYPVVMMAVILSCTAALISDPLIF